MAEQQSRGKKNKLLGSQTIAPPLAVRPPVGIWAPGAGRESAGCLKWPHNQMSNLDSSTPAKEQVSMET